VQPYSVRCRLYKYIQDAVQSGPASVPHGESANTPLPPGASLAVRLHPLSTISHPTAVSLHVQLHRTAPSLLFVVMKMLS
jgi:hypothetical protein